MNVAQSIFAENERHFKHRLFSGPVRALERISGKLFGIGTTLSRFGITSAKLTRWGAIMHSTKFSAGDWVIFLKQKHSNSSGRRAKNILPAENGDDYAYFVAKFWTVDNVLDDGLLRLRTRTGKVHVVSCSDPNLRRTAWWERWLYRRYF